MSKKSYGYRKMRYNKKKWSPVLVELNPDAHAIGATSTLFQFAIIAQNASNTNTAPTSTVIKVGNVKISFESESTSNALAPVSGVMFIMFVPQGLTPTAEYPSQHPEYIMGWRAFQPTGSVSAVTIQSRLKRNLNSGDKIVLLYKLRNDNTAAVTVAIRATVTYVCRAN